MGLAEPCSAMAMVGQSLHGLDVRGGRPRAHLRGLKRELARWHQDHRLNVAFVAVRLGGEGCRRGVDGRGGWELRLRGVHGGERAAEDRGGGAMGRARRVSMGGSGSGGMVGDGGWIVRARLLENRDSRIGGIA